MGDRTHVELTVLRDHAATVDVILDDGHEGMWNQEIHEGGRIVPITVFEFSEVSDGVLDELDRLIAHGIPYDSSWGNGENYRPGTESARFSPEGRLICKQVWDEDRNPDHHELMRLIDQPDQLREALLRHDERVSVPAWLHQVDYGIRHVRQRQLNIPSPAIQQADQPFKWDRSLLFVAPDPALPSGYRYRSPGELPDAL